MEQDSLYWKEKLELLEKGKSTLLTGSPQSVYSAVRTNPDLFKKKKFSIRTDKKPTKTGNEEKCLKRVIRIK